MKLDPNYDPDKIESKNYDFWLKNGFFKASSDSKKTPYTIVIPPPNVTGVLHMGHGLNNTIQDIIIRWKRMQGFEANWIPGTDHAGIATQNVVEKKLKKELHMSRHQLGRDKMIEEIWKWKEQNGSTIIQQLKKLGSSCDWDRERFTMDEGLSDAVKEVFVSLHEKGLIYRGKYIINWCPRCGTALADEEAEHKDTEGALYHIKYPVKGENDFVIVATTRPETMLGDTAVAINPKDQRYTRLHGKTLILPLVGREIPVILDEMVDMEFGTGCVKVTPAHDPNDFEMGRKHNLEFINILTPDAKMNENVPEQYQKMDRFDCRKQLIEDLEKQGMFLKKEKHLHAVGHCYRCDTVVEPYLSEQWFVKMKPLAEPALKAVEDGTITLYPERWRKVYLNWMNNIRDWCISRQIWWGHRIPVWYCECGEVIVSRTTPTKCGTCGSSQLRQDEDVLDTWFSSWLWPFSTLGWPEKGKDLSFFYPTQTLVTDAGIIFFWVARMIMAGYAFMGKAPFKDVYIHGTIMDSQGRKMSKSLGNGIDPLDVIKSHGADALRYTITSITAPGQNVFLSMDKFTTGKYFANKIWNASKYILQNFETLAPSRIDRFDLAGLNIADRWILANVEELKTKVTRDFEKFKFNDAALALYDFIWHRFCDWYLEISKVDLYSQDKVKQEKGISILLYVLKESLKLLHPIMPFITEEIWQALPEPTKSIMIEKWPEQKKEFLFEKEKTDFEFIKNIIYSVRNIRGETGIEPSKKIHIIVKCTDKEKDSLIVQNVDYIKFLAAVEKIDHGNDMAKPEQSYSYAVDTSTEVIIPIKGNIDVEKEKARLEKEITKLSKDLEKLVTKLSNPNFTDRAPPEVVTETRNEKSEIEQKMAIYKKNLEGLTV